MSGLVLIGACILQDVGGLGGISDGFAGDEVDELVEEKIDMTCKDCGNVESDGSL